MLRKAFYSKEMPNKADEQRSDRPCENPVFSLASKCRFDDGEAWRGFHHGHGGDTPHYDAGDMYCIRFDAKKALTQGPGLDMTQGPGLDMISRRTFAGGVC